MNDLLTTRFFHTSDKRVETVVFPLPSHWWSRFYEYAWAAEFCKETDIVLDAACGIPHPFKFYLAEKCKEVHAVDSDLSIADADEIDRQMKSVLGHSIQEIGPNAERVIFKYANITDMPYNDCKFDIIFCISAIEHLSSDKRIETLKEFRRTLKDDGKIILTIDYCTGTSYDSMTIDELEAMAKEAGLKIAGEVDKTPHANAINWQNILYCYRAVLVKDEPEKKAPTKPKKTSKK